MADTEPNRPLSVVLVDLLNQLSGLARTEGRLVRAEMAERIGRIGLGLGLVIAGSVLLVPALVILLQALVAVLASAGLGPRAASFAVGGAILVIGVILFAVGASCLRARHLLPDRTIRQLQRDAALAKDGMRSSDGIRDRAA